MSNAYSAYNKNQSSSETVRETEARALLRCASKLEAAQAEGVGYFEYCEAVRQNQKLWTIFQASLMESNIGLPADLVDILKNLSIYVDRRSIRAFVEHRAELLTVLININKQIAAGLMQVEAEKEAAASPRVSQPATPPSIEAGSVNIAG